MVAEWIQFMQAQGIRRVINLLDENQMTYFASDLMQAYERAFGPGQAIWVPVPNFHLIDAHRLKTVVFPFLGESVWNGESVVVHCAGGIGRTGHVLAAWMVHLWNYSAEDAMGAVRSAGAYRDPAEAVAVGNATLEDLYELLEQSRM
jgi:protein-tyrosine phosphatase